MKTMNAMSRGLMNRGLMMCGFIACVVVAGYVAVAAAQNATVVTGNVDDLRPLYADSADISEGERLAESSCSACHGAGGISDTAGVPHLAGQRSAYLYRELHAYQSGARGDSAMNNAVKFLNEDALIKVSAYYASLDPPQVKPASGTPAARPDAVQAGKTASAACAGCHGEIGVSKTAGMPSLSGQDPKYLIGAMKDYQSGVRKNDLMKSMLASIGDAGIGNIALYFALQKPEPAKAAAPAAGDQASGKSAAAACAGCHGEQGVSAIATTPSLAGQDAQYIVAALAAYKDGTRNNETMKGLAAALDDATMKNLAAFYAHQQPHAPDVRKPLTTKEWSERCDRCHGLNGNSTNPRLPALAGQRIDYLSKVLHAYRTGERKSAEMAAMSDVLTESDIENLAAHYATQKTRSAVYVVTPAK